MPSFVERAWTRAKIWRRIKLGPVAFLFRLAKTTDSSPKHRRRPNHRPHLAVTPNDSLKSGVAMIVGVGGAFGYSVAKCLAQSGMRVAVLSRTGASELASELIASGLDVRAFPCDATHEPSVEAAFGEIERLWGAPEVVVYGVQGSSQGQVVDIEVAAFEECWRKNCLGAFIVGRAAARSMVAAGNGTIVFAGATSGLVGRAGYLNLAVGKFGLRALAQVMARELGPRGIHVAHLLIDAHIDDGSPLEEGEPVMHADEIAQLVRHLHLQPKSSWTHELDARPWNEQFWEHC